MSNYTPRADQLEVSNRRRQMNRRWAWLVTAVYLGSIVGQLWFTLSSGGQFNSRLAWDLLNPVTHAAIILGAVITPGVNVGLFVIVTLSYVYLRARIPLWGCIIHLGGMAYVAYWMIRSWSVQGP